jgi:hypothetical protein
MFQYTRQVGASLTLSLALLLGACGDRGDDSALATDSALNRDLELANRDTAAVPSLEDVPPATTPEAPPAVSEPAPSRTPSRTPTRRPTTSTTRPSTPAPAPKAEEPTRTASGNTESKGTAGSEGTVGSIASGTSINLTSGEKVCTNTNKVGDRFTARVSEAISGSNGVTIPAGATAVLELTSLKHSENVNDPVVMGFAVRSVTFGGRTYNVDAEVSYAQVDKVRSSTRKDDAKKVIGGAVIGAIAGQVIGKDTKGTVIGAATGAAAGAAAAAATGDFQGCVNSGNRITIRLTSPVSITAA